MLLREDHTVGNLLRMQLLREENVLFAGYKHPHPLVNDIEIRIQTKGANPGPIDTLSTAIDDLSTESEVLMQQFKDGVTAYRQSQDDMGGYR